MHNVLNALAAIAVATEVQVPDAAIQKALAEFRGVGRRFQRYGEVASPSRRHVHAGRRLRAPPGRMAATLAAAGGPSRSPAGAGFPAAPLQRTRDCFEDFVKVLNGVDALLLGEVYAAGEVTIVAADGRSLARGARCRQGGTGLRRGHRDDAASDSGCRPRGRRGS